MKENQVKRAFEAVQPESGAEERMYANILKKAAAQQAAPQETLQTERAKPGKRRSWQRWGSLAACLALVAAMGLALPRLTQRTDPGDSGLLAGSPLEEVQSAADFAPLGFTIDAPEHAGDVSYCILDGNIAQVNFTLDGHHYSYRAAGLDGDFSGVNEDAADSISLNAAYDAVLERLLPDGWRAHWSRDAISCYLTNFDGAEEQAVAAVVNELLGGHG